MSDTASAAVTLCRRTGAGGESVRRALAGLSERGPACARLVDALATAGIPELGLNKWSVPVLAALTADRRFSELRGALPGVSRRSRVLTPALEGIAAAAA
jgi:hypothetical protein